MKVAAAEEARLKVIAHVKAEEQLFRYWCTSKGKNMQLCVVCQYSSMGLVIN